MSAAAGKFGMIAGGDARNALNKVDTDDGQAMTREYNYNTGGEPELIENIEIDNPQAPPTRKKVGTPYKMKGHALPGIKQRKK